ncbi:hypothetical protein JCM8115_006315 [Rhodotorula mucilaginosa]|uniref:COQ9 C-terminal domain-containing protein n=1 Tax=Rhodotorula mucilaginosa TaxID=5537 RepID=A0A9P6VXU8_RHOMI|nr:hypothetical protein C6P46_005875 [Rhodotorula mucilaginosa]
MATTGVALTRQLARAALPHVRQHGFTADAFLHRDPTLTEHTLHALYPSPPAREPAQPGAFSLKGLVVLGNGGKQSLSKQQLVALARGQGTARRGRERTGPARALVKEWLVQGRQDMVDVVSQSRLQGEAAYRLGIEARLKYNQDLLDKLPQALALLNAPTSTYLSDLSAALPVPHITGHLSHVAEIAHDLAKASGSQAQGTDWYSLRLRLGTVYALSELSLLAPSSSAAATTASSSEERVQAAIAYSRQLLEGTGRIGKELDNAGLFADWVVKSWRGIGRSLAA